MDRDSDESMAPALHTIEHESASAAIKSYKLSPSSTIRIESNVFDQVNGVFSSSFEVDDEVNVTDFMKNSSQHFNLTQYQTPSKSLSSQKKGSAGDVDFAIPKIIDPDAHDKTSANAFSHFGAGDACTKTGTNGWPSAHKMNEKVEIKTSDNETKAVEMTDCNEKGTKSDGLQSTTTTVMGFDLTFSRPSRDASASGAHCCDDHRTRTNLPHTATDKSELLDFNVSEETSERMKNSLTMSDKVKRDVFSATLVSTSFLSVDECNCVSVPSGSTTITTTAALKTVLKTTSSTALTSSTMSVAAVNATSAKNNIERKKSDDKDRSLARDLLLPDGEKVGINRLVPSSINTGNLQPNRESNHVCDKTTVVESSYRSSNVFNLPIPTATTASVDKGADSIVSNAAKADLLHHQATTSDTDNERTLKAPHVACNTTTVQVPIEHVEQLNVSEVHLPSSMNNKLKINNSESYRTVVSEAPLSLNDFASNDKGNVSLSADSPSNHVVNLDTPAPVNATPICSINEPVLSSTESYLAHAVPASPSSDTNLTQSAQNSNAEVTPTVSKAFSQPTTTTAHNSDTVVSPSDEHKTSVPVSNTENYSPKNDNVLSSVPDLMSLAQGIITGNHMQNLPMKVTNTLEEFAASIKRRRVKSNEPDVIFANNICGKTNSCTENLDFENTKKPVIHRITNVKELCAQQSSQHKDVLKCTAGLESRIHLLRERLNKLRAAGIARHARNQLSLLGKREKLRLSVSSDSGENRSGTFHKNELMSSPKINSPLKPDGSVSSVNTLQHQFGFSSSKDDATNIGILKKDLRDVRVAFDPDLTDGSSDEEVIEEHAKNCPEKAEISHNPHSSLPIRKTALWTWAHDRTSVAHRWTWLDAQVTGLEFKIQQHGELHRQLRTAKEKLVFGHQFRSNDPSADQVKAPQITTSSRKNCRISDDSANEASSATSPNRPAERGSNNGKQISNLEGNRFDLTSSISEEKRSTAARTRPLRYPLRHRRTVRASDVSFLSDKKLKPPTVRNECAVMEKKFTKHTPFHRGDGRSRGIVHSSVSSRATHHDHSYHKILSTPEDVPVSIRLSGFMVTNNSRFANSLRKSESVAEKRRKRKEKDVKRRDDRLAEKIKSRPKSATVVLERADKLIRSVSALQRITSMEDRTLHEHKRRRSLAQAVSDHNKRHRVGSVDSDAESSHHRSESGTPVFDSSANHSNNPHYQAVLKRKRATDQAFDINNIVIPHGLATTRIEKLQYKEILTPGWRTAKKYEHSIGDDASEEVEDLTDDSCQIRHDHYEILEKKKYMAYVEWNINKKNGTRSMSRANLPMDEEASSFFYPSFRASPTAPFAPTEFTFPASPDTAPISPALARTRRSSSDQSLHSNSSHPMERRRLPDSISSDDAQLIIRENSTYDSWEKRVFPLSSHEVDELHKEPIVCLKKLPKDFESNASFRPIFAYSNVDTNTAPKHKTPKNPDHTPLKRQRTDSHTSVVSRDDERHSDDSTTSSVSNRRARQMRAKPLRTASPIATSTHSHPKRFKSTQRDDFYYYSELDLSANESGSDEESLVSDDEKSSLKSSLNVSEQWVAKPVSRELTPMRGSTSGDECALGEQDSPNHKAPPLVLKIKKK